MGSYLFNIETRQYNNADLWQRKLDHYTQLLQFVTADLWERQNIKISRAQIESEIKILQAYINDSKKANTA